jgi:hypothetical protein
MMRLTRKMQTLFKIAESCQLLAVSCKNNICIFSIALFGLIVLIVCFLFITPVYSETQMQTPQSPEEIPVEPVKSVQSIEISDGLLSVELTNVEFGKVMKEIAEKAKFKVEIAGDVSHRKINTTFRSVDVEKGIRRLLTIIREKDFTISYNSAGNIERLDIFGSAGKPVPTTPPRKPTTQKRPKTTTPTIGQPPVPSQSNSPKKEE